MDMLIRLGFSSLFAALIIQVNGIPARFVFWNDTLRHVTISWLVIFAVLVVLIYISIKNYVNIGRVTSKIFFPLSSILLFLVIAVKILKLDIFLPLPQKISEYLHVWYAFPLAIAIYFVTLFLVKRF